MTKVWELVPSAARRFANVSEVNVLSLVAPLDDDEDSPVTLSVGTATRSVSFLASFPKLERAYLGGMSKTWHKFPYSSAIVQNPGIIAPSFGVSSSTFVGRFRPEF